MKQSRKLLALSLVVLMLCFMPTAVRATEISGEPLQAATFEELAEIVAAAMGDVTVQLTNDIIMNATLSIPAGSTIRLTDDGTTRTMTRSDAFTGAMFEVSSDASLVLEATAAERLVLDGAGVSAGAAMIVSAGSLTIENGLLKNANNTGTGGAIYLSAGSLTSVNTVYLSNVAKTGGAIDMQTKKSVVLSVEGGKFEDNRATTNGGALNCLDTAKVTVKNVSFIGNKTTASKANKGGAAVYAANNSTSFIGCTFENNTVAGVADSQGGAICFYALGAGNNTAAVSECYFVNNECANGGAIAVSDSGSARTKNASVTISKSEFTGNTATEGTSGSAISVPYDTAAALSVTIKIDECHFTDETQTIHTATPKDPGVLVDGKVIGADDPELPPEGELIAAISTFEELKAAVLDSHAFVVTLTWTADLEFTETLSVPAGMTLTIKDDGTMRTAARAESFTGAFFEVSSDATLVIAATTPGALVFDGAGIQVSTAMIVSAGSLTMENVVVKNAKSNATGGAVYLTSGAFVSRNTDYIDNTAKTGAAIDTKTKMSMELLVDGGTFANNAVTGNGGAINLTDTNRLVLRNASFNGNKVTGAAKMKGGAALYIANTSAEVENCSFTDNQVLGDSLSEGGAVCLYALGASKNTVSMKNCTFAGNKAPNGGALSISDNGKYRNSQAIITLEKCSFTNNSADNKGGAISIPYSCDNPMSCIVHLNELNFEGNTASQENHFYYTSPIDIYVDGTPLFTEDDIREKYNYSDYVVAGSIPDSTVADQLPATATASCVVVGNYAYTVKVRGNSNNGQPNYHLGEQGVIFRTDLTTGETVQLKNLDTGLGYEDYLAHANGMGGIVIDGEVYLFIVTLVYGDNALVRVKISGDGYTKSGSYRVIEGGESVSKSGIAVLGDDGTSTQLMMKTGANFYTAQVPHEQTDGDIPVAQIFSIDMSAVTIGDETEDASGYTWQDFGYCAGRIYVPVYASGYSVVAVFEIQNPDGSYKEGTLAPIPGGSFRLGDREYRSFEVESVTITPDHRMYFNTNRTLKNGDSNYDAVCYLTLTPSYNEYNNCIICGHAKDIALEEDSCFSFTAGELEDITLRSNGERTSFAGLEINGEAVDPTAYVISDDETKVTISKSYLNALPAGKYTLSLMHHFRDEMFAEAKVVTLQATLTVVAKVVPPATGDDGIGACLMTGLAAMAVMCLIHERKNSRIKR